jgi:hypothetical protein
VHPASNSKLVKALNLFLASGVPTLVDMAMWVLGNISGGSKALSHLVLDTTQTIESITTLM